MIEMNNFKYSWQLIFFQLINKSTNWFSSSLSSDLPIISQTWTRRWCLCAQLSVMFQNYWPQLSRTVDCLVPCDWEWSDWSNRGWRCVKCTSTNKVCLKPLQFLEDMLVCELQPPSLSCVVMSLQWTKTHVLLPTYGWPPIYRISIHCIQMNFEHRLSHRCLNMSCEKNRNNHSEPGLLIPVSHIQVWL